MENGIFAREQMLFGEAAMRVLSEKHVAVFGLGGVGGHAAEALVRSGVGALTIVDHDTVSESNRNRQIVALSSTQGQLKTEVLGKRLLDINPALSLTACPVFFGPDNAARFPFSEYDYVLDCVDTVSAKLLLLECCRKADVPILASMGTGNKTDPTRLRVGDIETTSVCPLARVLRREVRKRGISGYRVIWSDEPPLSPRTETEEGVAPSTPGSTAFVPSSAGILMAREAVMSFLRELP